MLVLCHGLSVLLLFAETNTGRDAAAAFRTRLDAPRALRTDGHIVPVRQRLLAEELLEMEGADIAARLAGADLADAPAPRARTPHPQKTGDGA